MAGSAGWVSSTAGGSPLLRQIGERDRDLGAERRLELGVEVDASFGQLGEEPVERLAARGEALEELLDGRPLLGVEVPVDRDEDGNAVRDELGAGGCSRAGRACSAAAGGERGGREAGEGDPDGGAHAFPQYLLGCRLPSHKA